MALVNEQFDNNERTNLAEVALQSHAPSGLVEEAIGQLNSRHPSDSMNHVMRQNSDVAPVPGNRTAQGLPLLDLIGGNVQTSRDGSVSPPGISKIDKVGDAARQYLASDEGADATREKAAAVLKSLAFDKVAEAVRKSLDSRFDDPRDLFMPAPSLVERLKAPHPELLKTLQQRGTVNEFGNLEDALHKSLQPKGAVEGEHMGSVDSRRLPEVDLAAVRREWEEDGYKRIEIGNVKGATIELPTGDKIETNDISRVLLMPNGDRVFLFGRQHEVNTKGALLSINPLGGSCIKYPNGDSVIVHQGRISSIKRNDHLIMFDQRDPSSAFVLKLDKK